MIIDYFGLSEMGPVREDNQDCIRLPETADLTQPGVLFGIADGMGGFSHGEVASSVALEALYSAYFTGGYPQKINRSLQRGIEAANLAVVTEAQRLAAQKMGTTLTALALDTGETGDGRSRLHIGHIGDSRAYLVRGSAITCLTTDHTVVGDLLRMRVLTPDQVRTHARRSILTRAVGLELFIQAEFSAIELHEDDRLVLCTDGVWSAVEDEEIRRIVRGEANMQHACQNILNLALENGSDDNLSLIALRVQDLHPGPKNGAVKKSWLQQFFSAGRGPAS